MAIAIDFGTSNTVVARWNPVTQKPETLALPQLSTAVALNPPVIPSLVYVEDAANQSIVVGQSVRDRGLNIAQDSRFFRNFKRGVGAEIKGFVPELDGQLLDFEQVGQWFLTHVIETLRAEEPEIDALFFTVPVDSFERYRYWLGQICQSLDIQQVQMLDEPTAAALGYGLTDQKILLVVDFGGGTLDLSVVQFERSLDQQRPTGFLLKWGEQQLAETSKQKARTARVLAKAGENLGGSDIDHWLVDHFFQTQGLEATPLILRLAEKLKIQLSAQPQATEVYFNEETFDSYELQLDREQFTTILKDHQFFERLDERLQQVLQQVRRQGLEAGDIDAVLLVGGTAQIPAVQDWIQQYFSADQIRCDRPFEAIAQGALQLAQGIEIKDFLYHSYGVRYWNRRENRHSWHPIIRQGQAYPMSTPIDLVLGASVENQPSIELILGELGDDSGGTEIYFEGDRLLTRTVAGGTTQTVQPLNDRDGARTLAKLDPPGFPGSDRIRVQFQVDQARFLKITVEDLITNELLVEDQPVVQLQ